MGYFDYTIKYIIRRIIRLILNKKTLFLILVCLGAIFLLRINAFCATIPDSAGTYENTPEGYINYGLNYITQNNLPHPDNYMLVAGVNGVVNLYFTTNNSDKKFTYTVSTGDRYTFRAYNCLNFGFRSDKEQDVTFLNKGYDTNNNEKPISPTYATGAFTYYSNIDILPEEGGETMFPSKPVDGINIDNIEKPIITTTTETLGTGYFDYVTINSEGFYGDNWQNFYLLTFDYSTNNDDITSMYARKEIYITKNSSYLVNDDGSSYTFMIPSSDLGLNFKNNNNYSLKLATSELQDGFVYYDYFFEVDFTVAGLTDAQQNNNNLNNINSSLNNPNINIDSPLPQSSTNDITSGGFDSIFTIIKNAFTTQNSTPIVMTVPFTNKSFTIDFNSVYNGLNLGVLSDIINAFWWFVICLYIAKDIAHKIEQLKSGNIENVETDNIKEGML